MNIAPHMLPAKDSSIEPISRFRNLYSPFQSESSLSILLRRPIGVMGRHGADKRIGANHDMVSYTYLIYIENRHIVVGKKIIAHMDIPAVVTNKQGEYGGIFA